MSAQSVTLSMVEAHLARKSKRLGFPPEIEVLYTQQMESYHGKVMAKGVLPAVLIYNLFLLADLVLLPQTLLLATALHLTVVTPMILAAAFVYPRTRRQRVRELAATAIPFMMVAQIMFIYTLMRHLALIETGSCAGPADTKSMRTPTPRA